MLIYETFVTFVIAIFNSISGLINYFLMHGCARVGKRS